MNNGKIESLANGLLTRFDTFLLRVTFLGLRKGELIKGSYFFQDDASTGSVLLNKCKTILLESFIFWPANLDGRRCRYILRNIYYEAGFAIPPGFSATFKAVLHNAQDPDQAQSQAQARLKERINARPRPNPGQSQGHHRPAPGPGRRPGTSPQPEQGQGRAQARTRPGPDLAQGQAQTKPNAGTRPSQV